MEVYNAHTRDYDEDLWDRVLASGKLIYGMAADDSHRLYSEAGKGWIVVRSDVLDRQPIKEAIDAGDYYASSGIILNDYDVDSKEMIVDSQNGTLIEFIGTLGEVLKSVEGAYGFYQFAAKDGLFNPLEFYVRARISDVSGKYAWTQPRFFADPYADSVVDHRDTTNGSPYNALGIPHEGKVPSNWERYAVRIPKGAFLTLDMGQEEEIHDRDGPDFFIEEIDGEDGAYSADPYHVYASMDNINWVYIAKKSGDAYFDLAGKMDKARYIRIQVSEGDVEIDGIEANFKDAFADRVINYSGMSAGYPRYVTGPPSPGAIPVPWENFAVRINEGGWLDVDLGPGEEVEDAPGDDIYIEEVDKEDGAGFTDDAYAVYGSQDKIHWVSLGSGTGDGSFDLSGRMGWLRYLRLVPLNSKIEIDGVRVAWVGVNWCEGDFDSDKDVDGADLDAFSTETDKPSLEKFSANFGRNSCP